MPRPKKLPQQSRLKRLPETRVSEAELATIRAKAATAGLTQSEYQRRACLHTNIVVKGKGSLADVEILRDLGAIGNNLNQLTRMEHIHSAYDQQRLRQLLDIIEDITRRILEER